MSIHQYCRCMCGHNGDDNLGDMFVFVSTFMRMKKTNVRVRMHGHVSMIVCLFVHVCAHLNICMRHTTMRTREIGVSIIDHSHHVQKFWLHTKRRW